MVWFLVLAGTVSAGSGSPALTASGPPASLMEFPLPNPGTDIADLAAGPDGNMWAPYSLASTIARITPAGSISELPLPSFLICPAITAGSDGNLWNLDGCNNTVDRITPDGATITSFPIPGAPASAHDITLGPDGNVWFTQNQTGLVGFVTPAGAVTQFDPPGNSGPEGITAGPDGNLWFTDQSKNTVDRITPSGAITEFKAPPAAIGGPYSIAAGGDGNLWYTRPDVGVIGRVTPGGVFTEFYLPAGTHPFEIAAAPDGNLWFADGINNQIGRITTDGVVGLFTLATPFTFSYPRNLVTGPDGRLWFTMQSPTRVGAFAPFAPAPSRPDVRSVAPRSGAASGGTTVLITGYQVGSATQVLFGDTPATSFTVLGPGQVSAVAPAHAVGQANITVVTAAGRTAVTAASAFFYPSPQCGRVITHTTTLDGDVGPCYDDGVVIGADDVTLDLGGHRVFGFPQPSGGSAAGVRLSGRTGVTVTHGTVSGFDAGVVISGGSKNTLTGLAVRKNVGPDDFNTELGDGIFIEDSSHNQVVANTLNHNGIFDGIGIFGAHANANRVEHNLITGTVGPSDGGPAGQGIIVNGATGRGAATWLSSTRVMHNVVRDNASAGIANINHRKGMIVDNTVTGNGRTNSVGNGIGISVGPNWDPALPVGMVVQGNEVHENGVDGIRIAQTPCPAAECQIAGDNEIVDNDAADNNTNPAVNTYEGSPPAFDLHDQNADCDHNTWSHNTWGSAGYTPACTATGGSGPAVTANTARRPTHARRPHARAWKRHAKAWRRLLNYGRR